MMTTALVIGGGVAGPVAAMALQRAGIDAVVYEAHPGPADDAGAFLTLQVNGLDALRAVDAGDTVAQLGFATTSMRFRSGSGKLLGEVSTGAPLPDGTVGDHPSPRGSSTARCRTRPRGGVSASSAAADWWTPPRSRAGCVPCSPTAAPPTGSC